MRIISIAALVAVALVAGCASHPNDIKPNKVAGDTCTASDRQRLADLEKVQASTAANDAMGVFLIGVPVGSMGGSDHAAEIARLKGACGVPAKSYN